MDDTNQNKKNHELMRDWIKNNPPLLHDKYDGKTPEKDYQQNRKRSKKQGSSSHRSGLYESVDAELDLHGKDIDEAIFELADFVVNGRQAGYSKVRVIHGFGQSNSDPHTVRNAVQRWLKGQGKKLVKSYEFEHRNEGAMHIFL